MDHTHMRQGGPGQGLSGVGTGGVVWRGRNNTSPCLDHFREALPCWARTRGRVCGFSCLGQIEWGCLRGKLEVKGRWEEV